MTTTSGSPSRSGSEDSSARRPPSPPTDGPRRHAPLPVDPADSPEADTPSSDDPAVLCDQARDLASNGHLKQAAGLYRRVVAANPPPAVQARALLGLAVVEDQRGDLPAARDAARRALATGDARHAPRAAYHLALSLEQEGAREEAARVWRRLLDLGGPAYTAVAHHGLARDAEERGETDRAEVHWEAALDLPADQGSMSALHADTVVEAARDLAGRLLERGRPEAAGAAVERGLAVADIPELRLLRAAAHLEHAIADLDAVAAPEPGTDGTGRPEPAASGAAVELLAGLLALRGEPDGAERVWRSGLADRDPEAAEEVRRRMRRGFAPAPEEDANKAAGFPWWEPYLEEAAVTSSTPVLAGELFAVVTRMHALLAVPLVEGEARPSALRSAMEQALRTPSDTVWGADAHADFRRRLHEAMGEDPLPEGWPEHGTRDGS